MTSLLFLCAAAKSISSLAVTTDINEVFFNGSSPTAEACEYTGWWPGAWRLSASFYTTCGFNYIIPTVPVGLVDYFTNRTSSVRVSTDNIGTTTADYTISSDPGGTKCSGTLPANAMAPDCIFDKAYPGTLYPAGIKLQNSVHNQGWLADAETYLLTSSWCPNGSQMRHDACSDNYLSVYFDDRVNQFVWATGGCVVAPLDAHACGGSQFCCSNTGSYPSQVQYCGASCYNCTLGCQ